MDGDSDRQPIEGEVEYETRYWLDVGDVIVKVDSGWEAFARENQATELDVRRVIGRNLLSFIQGDATRMYVRTLIQSARLQRRPLVRQYRCDSPEMRRYMEMSVTLEPSGLLCWAHRQLKSEPLARRMAFTVAPARSKRSCVVRCSMCNRLKSPTGWREPDEAGLEASAEDNPIPVIYGVCPECLAFPGRHQR